MTEHSSRRARAGWKRALAAELARARRVGRSRPPTAASRSPGDSQLAYRANLEVAPREPHPVARRRRRLSRRSATSTSSPRRSTGRAGFAPTARLRVDVAATRSPLTEPRVRHAAHQGRRLRPASAPAAASAQRSTSERPDVRVHAYLTAIATRRSTSTPRASRCSSAATGASRRRRRCARISRRACCALAGWTAGTPLLDPMCGSGTIAVEAALIALDLAPGLARTFGFQKLAWYDGPAWQRIKQAAQRRARPPAPVGASGPATTTRTADPAMQRATWPRPVVAGPIIVERADALTRARPAPAGVIVSQSAVWRAARRLGRAGRVLPAARRCAQAARTPAGRLIC